uniref:Putative ovule protein n=1 Tax=Solanum chacoense TaxID=4108 RepID=A0A0V0IEF7_SOLCH
MEEHGHNLPSQQTGSDKNLRRRTRYAEMSPKRKELFLSQLRTKRAESKRQKTLDQTNSTAALTISTCSLAPQQASTSATEEYIVTSSSTFKQGIQENRDNLSTQQITFARNSRRRSRYAQMPPEQKQLLLSQLRNKRAESKRQQRIRQSNSAIALTITAPPLSPQQCYASTSREHIVNCISTFEPGSTSASSHVASKLRSTHAANKVHFSHFQQSTAHTSDCHREERFCYWTNNTFSLSITQP